MQITTLDHIPGQAWEEMGAPLFSEQVQAVNAAKDLVGGIKAMFGGAVRAYSQEYQRARAAALADLTAQGAAWGGRRPCWACGWPTNPSSTTARCSSPSPPMPPRYGGPSGGNGGVGRKETGGGPIGPPPVVVMAQ